MNTRKEIKKLFEKVDENKESLLILHVDENDDFAAYSCGERIELAAGIAALVHDGFKPDAHEGLAKIAHAIIDGVTHAMNTPSLSAATVIIKITKALIESHEILEEIKNKLGFDDDDHDTDCDTDKDKDNGENCEDCENNRWCPLSDAVKYRKENHIPAPKKHKRGGKNGSKKNGKD